jgi:hypothetical protein
MYGVVFAALPVPARVFAAAAPDNIGFLGGCGGGGDVDDESNRRNASTDVGDDGVDPVVVLNDDLVLVITEDGILPPPIFRTLPIIMIVEVLF